MQKQILVIGELNVDLLMSGLSTMPELGKETLAPEFNLVLGSASAIFACGAARLGHPVTFLSKVGQDAFGTFCTETLEHAGISTGAVLRSATAGTGITAVLSTPEDRALVSWLGAIADLHLPELEPVPWNGHDHLHLTSYFLQHALRPDFLRMVHEAKAHGLSVSFDPNSDPAQAWGPEVDALFSAVDVVFLNEMEAMAATSQKSVPNALAHLRQRTACIVIKLGKFGALAARNGDVAYAPGYKVDAVDTTGAGDSFAAGFVHALLEAHPLEAALAMGNAVGALSTLGKGGTGNQPDLAAALAKQKVAVEELVVHAEAAAWLSAL